MDTITQLQSSDEEDQEHCICKSGESGKMILCDSKSCTIGWWHYECAKIKRAPAKDKKWFCPNCKD